MIAFARQDDGSALSPRMKPEEGTFTTSTGTIGSPTGAQLSSSSSGGLGSLLASAPLESVKEGHAAQAPFPPPPPPLDVPGGDGAAGAASAGGPPSTSSSGGRGLVGWSMRKRGSQGELANSKSVGGGAGPLHAHSVSDLPGLLRRADTDPGGQDVPVRGTSQTPPTTGGGSAQLSRSPSSGGFLSRQRASFTNLMRLSGVKSSPGKSMTEAVPHAPPTVPVVARISSHSIRGPRHANGVNEDKLLLEPDVFASDPGCDYTVGLFGVFDGHGGETCAAMAAEALPKHFREAEAWGALAGGALRDDATAIERVLVGALEHAFYCTARGFEAHAEAAGDTTGACALVAAVCEGVVVIANVGDSKGIMYMKEGDKQSVRSTARHNAENPDEVARVIASGGHFIQNRLLGCLLPTRALGNLDCLRLAPGVLSSRPQFQVVRVRPLGPGDAAALVLASDGLWDMMETPQVVGHLKAGLKRQARQLATVSIAQNLVVEAVRTGSDDDTTAIVLVLK